MNNVYHKVNRGFQITLPIEFREKFNLAIGSMLSIRLNNGQLIIEPCFDKQNETTARLRQIFNELDNLPAIANSEEDVIDIIDQTRR